MKFRFFSKDRKGEEVVIPTLVLYTREGCTLCEEMKEILQALSKEFNFHLLEIDIDQDPRIRAEYNDRIPYLVLEGKPIAKYRLDIDKLRQRFTRLQASRR